MGGALELDVMATARNHLRLLLHLFKQRGHIHRLLLQHRCAGFQCRQGQQILYQALHPPGLF